MPAVNRNKLDMPPQLSGVIPLVDRITDLCDAVSRLQPEIRPMMEEIRTGVSSLHQLYGAWAKEHPPTSQEERFWNRTRTTGIHIVWVGMTRTDNNRNIPICNWTSEGQTVRTTAARVAWLLLRGQRVPEGTNLTRTCQVLSCIAPECHTLSNDGRTRKKGIRVRKDIMYGDNGLPMCARRGHPLTKLPKPGHKLHCPPCYALDKLDQARLDKARQSVELAALRDFTRPPTVYGADLDLPVPPRPTPDLNPDGTLKTPTPLPQRTGLPTGVASLFEDPED